MDYPTTTTTKGWWKDANTNKLQPDKAIVIDKTFLDQMDKNS